MFGTKTVAHNAPQRVGWKAAGPQADKAQYPGNDGGETQLFGVQVVSLRQVTWKLRQEKTERRFGLAAACPRERTHLRRFRVEQVGQRFDVVPLPRQAGFEPVEVRGQYRVD